MDSICPAASVTYSGLTDSFLTSSSPTLLNGTVLSSMPTYSPSSITSLPTYRNPKDNQTYTAVLANIGDIVLQKKNNRYDPTNSANLSQDGYWKTEASRSLEEVGIDGQIYSYFTSENVPTKNYLYINTEAQLASGLTGTVDQKKISVSYDLLYSLQYEFCYYTKLYRTLLSDYIKILRTPANDGQGSTFTTTQKNNVIKELVNRLNATNLRLKDITEISTIISSTQKTGISNMNQNIDTLLANIKKNAGSLKTNSEMLTSKDLESRLRSRMLEYSEEKNAYANQLLGLYGFANLIALGLLFYIYKS